MPIFTEVWSSDISIFFFPGDFSSPKGYEHKYNGLTSHLVLSRRLLLFHPGVLLVHPHHGQGGDTHPVQGVRPVPCKWLSFIYSSIIIIIITLFILNIFITGRHPSHRGNAPRTTTSISCLSRFVKNHIAHFRFFKFQGSAPRILQTTKISYVISDASTHDVKFRGRIVCFLLW